MPLAGGVAVDVQEQLFHENGEESVRDRGSIIPIKGILLDIYSYLQN